MQSETLLGLSHSDTVPRRAVITRATSERLTSKKEQTFRQLRRELSIVGEYGRLVCRAPVKFSRQARRDYSLRSSGDAPGWQQANLACRIIDDIADGERTLVSGFASFPALIDQARSGKSSTGHQ